MPARLTSADTRPLRRLGGFAGVRLLWDEAVLLRVELGYAAQGSAALYVSFGEEF